MPAPVSQSFARRLLGRYSPGAHVGLVVRVIPAASHEHAGAVVHTPDHFLGAAWLPPEHGLARWPEAVVIGSPDADHAIAQLLTHLPDDARLYLAGPDEVDAALAATILRHGDLNLEPYQRAGLDAFIAAQRQRERSRIASAYTDRDPRYEQFRAVVMHGALPSRGPDD